MTRINVVDPKILHQKHLVVEYREIPRVFGLARSGDDIPTAYTLGAGHVKFFYDKLLFITIRHRLLVLEMQRRGYMTNHESLVDLLYASDPALRGNYRPTFEAKMLNLFRLREKLPGFYP